MCFKPDPKVCAEFFKSDAVFVATVVSERTVLDKGGFIDGWWYRLNIHKTFRGARQKTVDVYTGNDSGRLRLEVGHEYLLFAKKYRGRLQITGCGNSGLMSKKKEKLQNIEQIKKTTSGSIEGHVASHPSWIGVAGIQVITKGEGNIYTTVTDQDGWFRMIVPPGNTVSRSNLLWFLHLTSATTTQTSS